MGSNLISAGLAIHEPIELHFKEQMCRNPILVLVSTYSIRLKPFLLSINGGLMGNVLLVGCRIPELPLALPERNFSRSTLIWMRTNCASLFVTSTSIYFSDLNTHIRKKWPINGKIVSPTKFRSLPFRKSDPNLADNWNPTRSSSGPMSYTSYYEPKISYAKTESYCIVVCLPERKRIVTQG